MDSAGRILAEVGGPDYNKRQYNLITQGQGMQPGSSLQGDRLRDRDEETASCTGAT